MGPVGSLDQWLVADSLTTDVVSDLSPKIKKSVRRRVTAEDSVAKTSLMLEGMEIGGFYVP